MWLQFWTPRRPSNEIYQDWKCKPRKHVGLLFVGIQITWKLQYCVGNEIQEREVLCYYIHHARQAAMDVWGGGKGGGRWAERGRGSITREVGILCEREAGKEKDEQILNCITFI